MLPAVLRIQNGAPSDETVIGWRSGRKSGANPRSIGKYEVLAKIGSGGFGTVYEGFDPLIRRKVAIKTCDAATPEIRARTCQEAQLAGRLQHPNITTVYDFGIEGDVPYIVQELLPGEDLDDRIARGEPLALARKLKILVGVSLGLEYAHKAGVIHRDIKPANIRLLDGSSAIKIMDFGIAKSQNAEVEITKAGIAVGSAGYMSPEQICGDPVDHRTDIFSFGLTAYELLSGRRAFSGENLFKLLEMVVKEEPAAIEELAPGLPPALYDLVRRAMQKEPSERFQTARELTDALVAIHQSLPPGDAVTDSHPLLPADEASRLAALTRYEILDSEPEPEFDDLVRLASAVTGCSIAVLAFLDRERHWIKARVGIDVSEISRKDAIGAHAVLHREVMAIEDLSRDPRFASHPLVAGEPGLRFWAGAPVVTLDGQSIGVLSVADRHPRGISAEQREGLAALARQVLAQLELKRRVRADRERSGEALIREATGLVLPEPAS